MKLFAGAWRLAFREPAATRSRNIEHCHVGARRLSFVDPRLRGEAAERSRNIETVCRAKQGAAVTSDATANKKGRWEAAFLNLIETSAEGPTGRRRERRPAELARVAKQATRNSQRERIT